MSAIKWVVRFDSKIVGNQGRWLGPSFVVVFFYASPIIYSISPIIFENGARERCKEASRGHWPTSNSAPSAYSTIRRPFTTRPWRHRTYVDLAMIFTPQVYFYSEISLKYFTSIAFKVSIEESVSEPPGSQVGGDTVVSWLCIDESATQRGQMFRWLHELNTRESEEDERSGVKAHTEDARLMELLPLTVLHSTWTPILEGVWMTDSAITLTKNLWVKIIHPSYLLLKSKLIRCFKWFRGLRNCIPWW